MFLLTLQNSLNIIYSSNDIFTHSFLLVQLDFTVKLTASVRNYNNRKKILKRVLSYILKTIIRQEDTSED